MIPGSRISVSCCFSAHTLSRLWKSGFPSSQWRPVFSRFLLCDGIMVQRKQSGCLLEQIFKVWPCLLIMKLENCPRWFGYEQRERWDEEQSGQARNVCVLQSPQRETGSGESVSATLGFELTDTFWSSENVSVWYGFMQITQEGFSKVELEVRPMSACRWVYTQNQSGVTRGLTLSRQLAVCERHSLCMCSLFRPIWPTWLCLSIWIRTLSLKKLQLGCYPSDFLLVLRYLVEFHVDVNICHNRTTWSKKQKKNGPVFSAVWSESRFQDSSAGRLLFVSLVLFE